ncbi:MAG: hypothetical protein IH943_04560 [Acidobacteria bacterium]|nr:hypothetical protein [Acidobacteriota bacterium]
MLKTLTASRTKKNCPHFETTITRTAGLERAACRVCGHISVAYLGDGITVTTMAKHISQAS